MIVDPPGEPKTKNKSFFSSSTIVGVIELNILLLDSIELAAFPINPYLLGNPGLEEKSSQKLPFEERQEQGNRGGARGQEGILHSAHGEGARTVEVREAHREASEDLRKLMTG